MMSKKRKRRNAASQISHIFGTAMSDTIIPVTSSILTLPGSGPQERARMPETETPMRKRASAAAESQSQFTGGKSQSIAMQRRLPAVPGAIGK